MFRNFTFIWYGRHESGTNYIYKQKAIFHNFNFSPLCGILFFHSSKIVFKTAGVLLEEMQDKGLNALNYKVIILDEVHERSAESDLVLVCVKQFLMKNKDLR